MKGKEIETALKNCTQSDCRECPYRSKSCISALHKDAFNYIQRLKQNKSIKQMQEETAKEKKRE